MQSNVTENIILIGICGNKLVGQKLELPRGNFDWNILTFVGPTQSYVASRLFDYLKSSHYASKMALILKTSAPIVAAFLPLKLYVKICKRAVE